MNVERPGPVGARGDAAPAGGAWPGLAPLTSADAPRFFGREQETRQLVGCVTGQFTGADAAPPVTLLSGPPGVGKTSLLRAGLVPRLRREQGPRGPAFDPVRIQFDLGPGAPDLWEQIARRVGPERRTWAPGVPRPVLVFDALEPLFAPAPPDAGGGDRAAAARAALAEQARDATQRVVLALRSGAVAACQAWLRAVGLEVCHVRLAAFSLGQAHEVARGLGWDVLTPEAAAALVRAAAAASDDAGEDQVDPGLLVLLGRALEERRAARGAPRVEADMVPASADELLAECYERAVADVGGGRRFVEEALAGRGAAAGPVRADEAERRHGVGGGALEALAARQVVRLSERDGALWVELAHPALARAARASAARRAARGGDGAAVLAHAHALLIGIDRYEGAGPLSGCVADARALGAALAAGGYPPGQVRLLLDAEATRSGILEATAALLARAEERGTVVLYYAGHGTARPASGGGVRAGGVLVPADYRADAGGPVIDAHDVERVLAATRVRRGVLVADTSDAWDLLAPAPGRVLLAACAAGEHASELPGAEAGGGPGGAFTRAVLDGLRGAAADARGDVRVLALFEYAHARVAAGGRQHPTIVGGDLSDDFVVARSTGELPPALPPMADGAYYDAFLSFADADAGAVWEALAPRLLEAGLRVAVAADVRRAGVLRAATVARGTARARRWLAVASPAFAGSDAERALSAAARDAGADAAGRLAYLTAGGAPPAPPAPPAASPAGPAAPPEVALDAVLVDPRALAALVAWLRGQSAAPDAAPEAADDGRLGVALAADAGADLAAFDALHEAFAGSSVVRVVPHGAAAPVRAHLLARRDGADPGAAAPQLGAVDEPTWAVLDDGGRLLAPPRPAADWAAVRAQLEAVARYRQALASTNPGGGAAGDRVTLELMRQDADGRWHVAEPGADGVPVFEAGERVGFRVTSRHDRPVYLTLLDFGPTWSIAVLHPPPGAQDRLSPGRTFVLNGRERAGFRVTWPAGLPYVAGEEPVAEARETVRLVVTAAPVDLAFLQQGALGAPRPRRDAPAALERQLFAALGALGAEREPSEDDEGWSAVDASFVVRRAGEGRLTAVGAPDPLVAAFSGSALRALRVAEAYRRAEGADLVGAGHLLAGLYAKTGGWVRALVELGRVETRATDLARLAELAGVPAEAGRPAVLPHVEPAPFAALRTLPLSAAARQALGDAVRLGAGPVTDGPAGGAVRARHLLAGVLALRDDPAGAWLPGVLGADHAELHDLVTAALRGALDVERVRQLRRRSGERLFEAGAAVYALAFHPTGALVAAGSHDGTVRVWRTDDGAEVARQTLREGALVVDQVCWSPDGTMLAANAWQGGVWLWRWGPGGPGVAPGMSMANLSEEHHRALAFSPDGRWLIAQHAEHGGCTVWAPPEFAARPEFVTFPSGVRGDVAFTPDGRLALVSDVGARRIVIGPADSPPSEAVLA